MSVVEVESLREPSILDYVALDSDICELDEIYVFNLSGIKHQLVRRKIGGWVNISRFKTLMSRDLFPSFDYEEALIKNKHYMGGKRLQIRHIGTWVSLEDARRLAIKYNLQQQLKPLLEFRKIGLVKHCGEQFWEMFVSLNMLLSVRVLRRASDNYINVNQLCDVYELTKGKKKNKKNIRRQFSKTYKGVLKVMSDHTLCGGKWIPLVEARNFAIRYGIYSVVGPILSFENNDPSTIPDDVLEQVAASKTLKLDEALSQTWKPLSKNVIAFKGYPKSFEIEVSPRTRKVNLKLLTEVVSINLKEKRIMERAYPVLRRYSDGWVNGSTLITAACALRISDLNDRSDEDPDMQVANELYYRDLIPIMKHECISAPLTKSKSLNGYWIPVQQAKELLKEFHLKNPEKLYALLISDNFVEQEEEVDEDGIEILTEAPSGTDRPPPNVELLEDSDDDRSDESPSYEVQGNATSYRTLQQQLDVINLDVSDDDVFSDYEDTQPNSVVEKSEAPQSPLFVGSIESPLSPTRSLSFPDSLERDDSTPLGALSNAEEDEISDTSLFGGLREASLPVNGSQIDKKNIIIDKEEQEKQKKKSDEEKKLVELMEKSYTGLLRLTKKSPSGKECQELLEIVNKLATVKRITPDIYVDYNVLSMLKKIPNNKYTRSSGLLLKIAEILPMLTRLYQDAIFNFRQSDQRQAQPRLEATAAPSIQPDQHIITRSRSKTIARPSRRSPSPNRLVAGTGSGLSLSPAAKSDQDRDPRKRLIDSSSANSSKRQTPESGVAATPTTTTALALASIPLQGVDGVFPYEAPMEDIDMEFESTTSPTISAMETDTNMGLTRSPTVSEKEAEPIEASPIIEDEEDEEEREYFESTDAIESLEPIDRLSRYRALSSFETGSKLDLMKRAQQLFGNRNNGVVFVERLVVFHDSRSKLKGW